MPDLCVVKLVAFVNAITSVCISKIIHRIIWNIVSRRIGETIVRFDEFICVLQCAPIIADEFIRYRMIKAHDK